MQRQSLVTVEATPSTSTVKTYKDLYKPKTYKDLYKPNASKVKALAALFNDDAGNKAVFR